MKERSFNLRMIIQIISGLFILLFLYAATSKLLEYNKFELQIAKSPIIADLAYLLVWLVPLLEIITAVLLMIPKTMMRGLYASLALMTLFTAYIIAIINFSESIPCACGGVLQKLGWNEHLIFNIVFVLLAMAGIITQTEIIKTKASQKPG